MELKSSKPRKRIPADFDGVFKDGHGTNSTAKWNLTLFVGFLLLEISYSSTTGFQANFIQDSVDNTGEKPMSDDRSTLEATQAWLGDGGSGASSDEEDGIESSSEYEENWPLPYTTQTSGSSGEYKHVDSSLSGDSDHDLLNRHQTRGRFASPNNDPPMNESQYLNQRKRSVQSGCASEPLRTLEKLKQMLDESDYMTGKGTVRNGYDEISHINSRVSPSSTEQNKSLHLMTAEDQFKLWTSKDRAKYKRQQQRLRKAQEEGYSPTLQTKKLHHGASVTDDGPGYNALHLPVYVSNPEGDFEIESAKSKEKHVNSLNSVRSNPHFATKASKRFIQQLSKRDQAPSPTRQIAIQDSYQSGKSRTSQPESRYTIPPQHIYSSFSIPQHMPKYMYPTNPFLYSYPYSYLPNASYYAQQQSFAARYAAWMGYIPSSCSPLRPYSSRHPSPASQQNLCGISVPMRPQKIEQNSNLCTNESDAFSKTPTAELHSALTTSPIHFSSYPPVHTLENRSSFKEAGSKLSIDSVQKLSLMIVIASLVCYAAVSPRSLPLPEYNRHFYSNLGLLSLATIAPLINFLSVFDVAENDVNDVVNAFCISMTVGYLVAFVAEVFVTTLVRLGVFYWFEPDIFTLTPRVPMLVLPWVLRENQYRPKRITLFAADFGASCVVCPIIEELIKLKILQWTVELPKNFNWVTKTSYKNKKKRRVAEAIIRNPGEREVTSINKYVTHMLAVSMGMKLGDAGRRILMYTKSRHTNKSFYAICRGFFPIHELCGTATALALAKRDVLGVDLHLLSVLLPSVVFHGMANFRGMKPIFKWNSATPWSEMQLSPLNVLDDSTFPQLVSKTFRKLMWLIILCRVLGYCIKNYYMINRQAVKRTTTYAGKHAAFSAELAAAEMLKKQDKRS